MEIGQEQERTEKDILRSLREKIKEVYPECEKVSSANDFDKYLLAELWENLNQYDAYRYLNTLPDGTPAYGLPFDFREVDGNYHLFIPRVQDWHFIRKLPAHGEHPPFSETLIAQNEFSPFRQKALELFHTDKLDTALDPNGQFKPVMIEDESRPAEATPYHRFYWTEKGIVLELQTHPKLAQREKIDNLQTDFSRFVPVEVVVKSKDVQEPLSAVEAYAEQVNLSRFSAFTELPAVRRQLTHPVTVSDEGKLVVGSWPRKEKSPVFMCFGHLYGQLRDTGFDSGLFNFYIDDNVNRHADALGDFVVDQLAARKLIDMSMAGNESDDSQKDLLKKMETTMPQIGETIEMEDEKLPVRREVIEQPAPFILRLEGWEIPIGARGMIDNTTGDVTVELFTDQENFDNPLRNAVLNRIAQKLANNLMQQIADFGAVEDFTGQKINVKKATGKVYPSKSS